MNRSINGALLVLIVSLMAYGICYWFLIMPKFYPVLGEVHVTVAPPGDPIAVKFVGAALTGMLAGLFGFLAGRRLPARAGVVLHVLAWALLVAACIYFAGRETDKYIYSFRQPH